MASPVNKSPTSIKLPAFGLPPSKRLKTPSEYQNVYRSKQWGGSQHYTFNVFADGSENQLGVTVSKKVSKRAVDRNRIKRQIKEFYRHRQNQLQDAKLVITAKPSCKNASDDARSDSLEELWGKVLRWQRWQRKQQTKDSSD